MAFITNLTACATRAAAIARATSAAAAIAQSVSTLAGEGDQVFVATACAFHSQKAVLEPAAAQVVREFSLHEDG